jgi:hypothetical protein
VNVWGGDQNDPPVYGKVFIAAKPTYGYEITESEKLSVINDIIKPFSVVTVIPEFVNVDYNYLDIFAEVYFDSTKTTRSADSIKSLVRDAIVSYNSTYLNDFNSKFKLSRLLRSIDDCEQSISYSDATVIIEKHIIPQVGTARNYTLDYATPISREDPKHRIYSSPAFTQYDKEAVIRDCFLEETPGSSSGIDSIEVLSSGSGYLTTPTLVISGDGIGANAYPVIVNGKITQVVVDNPGTNYTTAVAYIIYEDSIDTTSSFTVSIQGRYGILRSYYFDNLNIKTILDAEAGTIDYLLGKIQLNQFSPVSISDPLKIFRVVAKPISNNFESARSRILTIDDQDAGSINITMKTVA